MRIDCLVLILAGALLGGAPAFLWADDSIKISEAPGDAYLVEGSFETPVTMEQTWDLLSDYGSLAGAVDSLVKSDVVGMDGDAIVVDQEARGSFLFFSRLVRVRLKIVETKWKSILFEDISMKDFSTYQGRWDLEELKAGVRVHYRLVASRGRFAPAGIEQYVFRSQAASMLTQLKHRLAHSVGAVKAKDDVAWP